LTAKIIALTRYPQKGEPGVSLAEMALIEGLGIEGDRHMGTERQLSICTAEARRWMEAQSKEGLCFGRFRENILLEGLVAAALTNGDVLLLGDTVVEILASGKYCFPQCRLFSDQTPCPLSEGVIFAAVLQGGTVSLGDAVRVKA